MEEPKQLQLCQPNDRAHRIPLSEQQYNFVLQSRAGELLDEIRGGRLCEKTHGGALKSKTESLFEPNRSEDARRIVAETAPVQDAECLRSQILPPPIGIVEPSELRGV